MNRPQAHPRLRQRTRDERGSITVWFATASLVMTILVGMTVDLGGKVHTQQHARSVAAQAARTGAKRSKARQPCVEGTSGSTSPPRNQPPRTTSAPPA